MTPHQTEVESIAPDRWVDRESMTKNPVDYIETQTTGEPRKTKSGTIKCEKGIHLKIKRLGINTYKEAVIYLHEDCEICRSEGWAAQARVQVTKLHQSIIATVNTVKSPLLKSDEAGLSEYAFQLLGAEENEEIQLSHPAPLHSLHTIHDKIFNRQFTEQGLKEIIQDVVAGRLSDIHIASFLTACADDRLSSTEIIDLTKAMVVTGDTLSWPSELVVDKHCIGGVPGNRTTLIVVPIVAAYGLTIPKTSSRAITSAAGTADTMEVFAPVELTVAQMRQVVEKEQGCIVWGGAMNLSPADDLLIPVEHVLNLDAMGQMIASILSKKISAGSKQIVLDVPIGETAKIRNQAELRQLKVLFESVASALNIQIKIVETNGTQPIGRGIGPALEARDALAILENRLDVPQDLRENALLIAGNLLEFSSQVKAGTGKQLAEDILVSGRAWKKFQAICDGQGGLRDIPKAPYRAIYEASMSGRVVMMNNYNLARLAKLAGAPKAKAAGVDLFVKAGDYVTRGQPLFAIHAQSEGELAYARSSIGNIGTLLKLEKVDR